LQGFGLTLHRFSKDNPFLRTELDLGLGRSIPLTPGPVKLYSNIYQREKEELSMYTSRLFACIAAIGLICLASSLTILAVTPAPDGGYPGQNTAEGEDALLNLSTGTRDTAIGFQALLQNTSGVDNTALGAGALYSNTTGYDNTASGASALQSNINGFFNTAIGNFALFSNRSGNNNTASGTQALFHNTSGYDNTAIGAGALFGNRSGHDNTATGKQALNGNTRGYFNVATGFWAMFSNTTGYENTANGVGALFSNTTGFDNVATGLQALNNSTTGFFNTASGNFSLFSLITGTQNTATGFGALVSNVSGNNNTAEGTSALFNSIGNNNIALGFEAGSDLVVGDNNIDIGNRGVSAESNTIRLGTKGTHTATYIAGVAEIPIVGSQVVVNTNGELGITSSSARFKDAIKPMGDESNVLFRLKPVTFRYKDDIDPYGTPQFGLVAEEVEYIDPNLVARDSEGRVNTVRYDAVNAMLLNEFLKTHRKIQEQEATIAHLQEQVEALTAGLEKVNAQLEVSKALPQMVLKNR